MDQHVLVYVEIEQFSRDKYEFNKAANMLELDRVLPYPYSYPYAYGFIEKTLATDGDELDALILTDKIIEKDHWYPVYIVGVLIMEDEKGLDEKVLCILEEDYTPDKSLETLSSETKDNIEWFFTHYKSKTPNNWSKVYGFENKERAIELWKQYSNA